MRWGRLYVQHFALARPARRHPLFLWHGRGHDRLHLGRRRPMAALAGDEYFMRATTPYVSDAVERGRASWPAQELGGSGRAEHRTIRQGLGQFRIGEPGGGAYGPAIPADCMPQLARQFVAAGVKQPQSGRLTRTRNCWSRRPRMWCGPQRRRPARRASSARAPAFQGAGADPARPEASGRRRRPGARMAAVPLNAWCGATTSTAAPQWRVIASWPTPGSTAWSKGGRQRTRWTCRPWALREFASADDGSQQRPGRRTGGRLDPRLRRLTPPRQDF